MGTRLSKISGVSCQCDELDLQSAESANARFLHS